MDNHGDARQKMRGTGTHLNLNEYYAHGIILHVILYYCIDLEGIVIWKYILVRIIYLKSKQLLLIHPPA